MKIRVTTHAELRLIQRQIDIDNAKKTMTKPARLARLDNGRMKATRQLEDGRVLTIIYVEEKTQFVIITGYYED